MVQFDSATGLLSLPVWLTAAIAAVIVALAVLAVARSGLVKTLLAVLALAIVGYGSWIGWQVTERAAANERADERRVFDQRVTELLGRATAPGSPLSCLDSTLIEPLTQGCEKILFGSPENVTAAVSYVTARISLLVDGLDLASRSDQIYDSSLATLRRGLEADRFGVVAHVMGQQPNCLPQQCDLLVLLHDANKVRVNLQDKPFEALVAKYSPIWGQGARVGSVADPGRSPIAVVPGMAPPAPISSRYELPSAASIPPVSIMNNENEKATPPPPPPPPQAATPQPQRRPPAVRAPVARSTNPPEPVPLAPGATGTSGAPNSPPAAR